MTHLRLFICFVILMHYVTADAQTITLTSLLNEMSDRDTLARYPLPVYASLQVSSYNRESVVKDGPGWFADSDGIGFMRTEKKSGKTEWVVMEHDGPGAITKMWAPYFYYGGLDDLEGPVINIYLDGEDTPAISENYFRLITGRGSVPPPFAAITARAGNSYLPIPFAKSCKVTFSSKPFYHIINYRAYPQGTAVKTFSKAQLMQALPLMDEVSAKLHAVYPLLKGERVENSGKIEAGESLKLTVNKSGAVNSLEIILDPDEVKQHPELLRSVVLVAEFDDEQTMWAPLGDFFGSANALNPFQTATRTVRSNGQMICTWLMPFRSNAAVYLKNLSNLPVQINHFAITVIDYSWNNRSMHFHANWRSDDVQPGNVFSDWNFIDIKGKGVLVGDAWTVLNPDYGWWGEGDEKIYVDEAWNKKFPTHFGTGTEDYYGWAGGENPSKDDRFSHPFLSNIEVGSATPGRRDVRGFNISTRIRALDAIPFNSRLVFDIEASPGTQIRNPWNFLGYSAVVFWYGFPGAVSNRPALPNEVKKPVMSLKQLDDRAKEISRAK
ncbi:glycoside hydrolase family 172 protein [Agriterribacter sp.]|uniref:glycoside hydrolase family 172 protein n=1 Tax=Agriterribacter sp. TaxID=2821509 RepID=UPI002CA2952A|nr:glycoside hydrolase family 172 protein [Agriterribacter sp.]HRP58280.1 DUF2961 domain-containing protein [Agriterribacter sp.]